MSDDAIEGTASDSTYGQGDPIAPTVPETSVAKALRRSVALHSTFIIFLILGLIGSIGLGVAGSSRTTLDAFGTITTTHDTGIGIGIFVAGAIATLTTTLPILGLSFVLEGQADILAGQDSDEDPPEESN